jgi:DNA-binding transcriptional LysR family regulator
LDATSTVLRNRLIARGRLRHLQALVRVADLGSVKRAADSIGMTQPGLTQVVADLESLLETQLFQRHARGMQATAVGLALLPHARRVLAAMDDSAELVAAMSARAMGQVRVTAISGALAGLLVRAIPAFGRAHPDVFVQLVEADPTRQPDLIAHQGFDLALCRAPDVLPEGWHFTPLLADRFVVVAGPQHALAGQRDVDNAALKACIWLASPTSTAARMAFDALFDPPQPELRQVSTRATAMLWAMLVAEPLLCLVPVSVVRQLLDAGQLVEVHTGRSLPFEPIGLLQRGQGLGDAALRLSAFLQAYARAEQEADGSANRSIG